MGSVDQVLNLAFNHNKNKSYVGVMKSDSSTGMQRLTLVDKQNESDGSSENSENMVRLKDGFKFDPDTGE